MPLIKRGSAPVVETQNVEEDCKVVSPAVAKTLGTDHDALTHQLAKKLADHTATAPVKAAHSKEDYWANREARDIETGIRIRRSGVWQAAAQSQALMQYSPTIEEYFVLVNRMAEEGLKWVNKE